MSEELVERVDFQDETFGGNSAPRLATKVAPRFSSISRMTNGG